LLEQIVYQTNADPHASITFWRTSGVDLRYFESEKGILTFYMKNPKVTVQLTPKGKMIFFVDSKISERSRKSLWRRLKRILKSANGNPVADQLNWLNRRPYPGGGATQHEVRLKALTLDAETDGSIESQLSVIDEETKKPHMSSVDSKKRHKTT
jgi:hypothetical protein